MLSGKLHTIFLVFFAGVIMLILVGLGTSTLRNGQSQQHLQQVVMTDLLNNRDDSARVRGDNNELISSSNSSNSGDDSEGDTFIVHRAAFEKEVTKDLQSEGGDSFKKLKFSYLLDNTANKQLGINEQTSDDIAIRGVRIKSNKQLAYGTKTSNKEDQRFHYSATYVLNANNSRLTVPNN